MDDCLLWSFYVLTSISWCAFAVTDVVTWHKEIAGEFKALQPIDRHSPKQGPLVGKTVNDALRILAPLRDSGGIEHAVAAFTGVSVQHAYTILDAIASREGFNKVKKGKLWEEKRHDFLDLIFGVVACYGQEQVPAALLFELLARYPGLSEGTPPLYVAASTPYAQTIIPALYAWLQEKQRPTLLKEAGLCALQHNNDKALVMLLTYLKQDLQPYLADFLWYVVTNKRIHASLAVTLLDAGAPVDGIYFSKYTPLIKAVEVENVPLIQVLIERGASFDKVVDDETGSAWQKAGEINNDEIMSYMSKIRSARFD